jgi:hypothetical protein
MADDDIVRRAGDHLKRTVDSVVEKQRDLPELKRVKAEDLPEVMVHGMKVEHVEIECDLCDYVAVESGRGGWETSSQPGPSERPDREGIGPFLLCTPCKESWEAANYGDLYERCDDRVRERVDDLAQLAGDTLRTLDPERDRWARDRGDDGLGYEW